MNSFVEREKMEDILTKLNLEALVAVFRRERIVPSIVESMSDEELERLGVLRLEIEFDCVNFAKKAKRTVAGHRLALEVYTLQAPQ